MFYRKCTLDQGCILSMTVDYAWVRQICDEFGGTVLMQQHVVSYYRVRLTKALRTYM